MKNYDGIARKLTLLLFLGQSLGSAGFIAAVTVNAIVGTDLTGMPSLAGLPSAVYIVGGALGAFAWGHIMERIGRRPGLSLGFSVGSAGAVVAGTAVVARSFPIFLIGLALMGVSKSAMELGRFAAAEVNPPAARGRAISNVVLGGTVGAIFGPLLVGPTGQAALSAGLPELAGPYSVGLILFAVAAILIFSGLRPDPRDLGREVAALHPGTAAHAGPTRPLGQIVRDPGVQVAMVSVIFAQLVMTMVMVITSLHMKGHQHSLGDISLVISSHTVGMYAFSVLSGRLSDRWGRGPVILVGSATLLISCVMAPISTDVLPIAIALFLLGLGWNFAYVGGSALLSDRLSARERATTQGFNDLLIGLASATGSLGSGFVFASSGFTVMAMVGAVASLAPLLFALWWQLRPARGAGATDRGAA
ncbi:MAG TPA: MFS transporter [Chloroflexota bacterium]